MRLSALSFVTLLAAISLAAPTSAQTPGGQGPPPVRQPVDDNGVDVIRLTFDTEQTPISIGGPGTHGLSYGQLINAFGGVRDSFAGTLASIGSTYVATIDNTSDSFTFNGSAYVPTEGNGATLTLASGIYTYTNRNGVVARFDDTTAHGVTYYNSDHGRLSDVTYPDGTTVTYHYKFADYCLGGWENGFCQTQHAYIARVHRRGP